MDAEHRIYGLIKDLQRRNSLITLSRPCTEQEQAQLRGLYELRDAYQAGRFNDRQLDNVLGALLAYGKLGATA